MGELRHEFVEQYLATITPPRDELLLEMEARAEKERIPIVSPEVGALLFILARASGARRILELGTAIGYSTIWLARGLQPGGHLVTVEWDAQRGEEARRYLGRAGIGHLVELRIGGAQEVAPNLRGPYDLIFNDIDKEGYPLVLPHCVRLLSERGLLVSDNALFHGSVPREDDTPAARALREYNQRVRGHSGLTSVILPVGDGVAVSVKGGF